MCMPQAVKACSTTPRCTTALKQGCSSRNTFISARQSPHSRRRTWKMSILLKDKHFKLGRRCRLDETVVLGEIPGGSKIRLRRLTVGRSARIRSGTVLYCSTTIGHHFETGHGVVVREENRIGHHVSIWNRSIVASGCCMRI